MGSETVEEAEAKDETWVAREILSKAEGLCVEGMSWLPEGFLIHILPLLLGRTINGGVPYSLVTLLLADRTDLVLPVCQATPNNPLELIASSLF